MGPGTGDGVSAASATRRRSPSTRRRTSARWAPADRRRPMTTSSPPSCVGCADRDARARALRKRGIETSVHYPLLPHLAPPYLDRGWRRSSFPVGETLADRTLSLPLYPQLTLEQCEATATALLEAGARP